MSVVRLAAGAPGVSRGVIDKHVFVKGAPEAVLAFCDLMPDAERDLVLEHAREMAGSGLREALHDIP